MTNRWNRIVYACWAPVYDRFIGLSPFLRSRRRAIERLALQPGDRLLIVGIGTGADLPLLPTTIDVAGVDISRAMLRVATRKVPSTRGDSERGRIQLMVADAAQLPFRSGEFDAVLLSLILSVVPDPKRCLAEVTRVASPNCRIVVFDKFVDGRPSCWRRGLNPLTRLFGTDINREIPALLTGSGLQVIAREPAAFGGAYELLEVRHGSCK